jgi:type IV secretion system protein VirB2
MKNPVFSVTNQKRGGQLKKVKLVQPSSMLLVWLISVNAYASGSGMPWEAPLQRVLDSFSGPVAKILGTIAIIATGVGMAFGEGGAGMKKLLQIVFGLSIAFTAASFGMSFFGFGGGLGF